LATPSDNNECGLHFLEKLIRPRIGKQHDEPRIGAELPSAHEAAGRKLRGDLAAALGQHTGKNHDRVDARHLEINRLPHRIGCIFQRHARGTTARERARPYARV
jgi:hypothetical protein